MPYVDNMVDLSFGSIVNGYITLLSDTSYTLMNNLVIDGSTFVGVSGGDATTYLNGQGYTISVSGSYDASASFPTQVNLSNLTLINPVSSESWGFASPDATCYAFTGEFESPIAVGAVDISSDYYIYLDR